MKIVTLIFVLFSTLFSSQEDVEKLEWRAGELLTWEDFKGEPENLSGYVASTNSGISFSYDMKSRNGVVKITYQIKTHFYPKASWYKRGDVNDYILAHEQAHFDISELFARKLKMQFAVLKQDENFKEKANVIYKNNEQERVDFQYEFDRETEHSKNIEEEEKWEAYIATQLKEYNDWR